MSNNALLGRSRRRSFRTVSAAVTALLVGFATLFVAAPATAAPVYEITARWVEDTPPTLASGDVVAAEWRVNVNDDAAAPSNEPVDDMTFTLMLENGVFTTLPDACLADGDPASSISDDGRTLVCNIGTQPQGSAHVIQTAIRADGETGSQVSASGTIDGQTAELPPIEILNEFGMDIRWESAVTGVTYGDSYVDASFQWTLSLDDGSDPGPDTVTYTLDIGTSDGAAVSVAPAACSAFTSGVASGHPWSGGDHPAEQMVPFVDSCVLTPTATPGVFTLTLSGIDYSALDAPTTDSAGQPLPADRMAIASGSVHFRVAGAGNNSMTLESDAPTYTSPLGGSATDDPANNSSARTWVTGGWSSAWRPEATGYATPSWWSDQFRVSPGAAVESVVSGQWASADPDAVFGQCVVMDTQYVTYESASLLLNWAGDPVPGASIEYYAGDDAVVDPTSGSYDPNVFECGDDPGGWTTTEPTDPDTVKAVRVTYPYSAMAGAARTTLNVRQQINDDTPIGQDVWQWGAAYVNGAWQHPSRSMDPADSGSGPLTPDARYPFLGNGRDIVRIIGVTPAVEKSVDRSVVRAGEPATYTLTFSANGAGAVPETVDDFELIDTLPEGMTYVPGSASPEPAVATDAEDRQVLTWSLDGVPTNTQVPLSYQAVADPSVEPGEILPNTVTGSVAGETSTPASAQVTVSTSGYTTIGKSADSAFIPNLQGDGVGEGSWTVTLRSFDPLAQDYTDTIDILPFNGDERGTEFTGSYELTGVDAVAGATVYYSTADPASLSDDPADPSNGDVNDVTGNTVGWSTTFTAEATAVRVIGPELAPGATQQFTVNVATEGVEGGDVLVNRAQARDGHTELVMRTSAPITVANYYSVSLKKYVQDADGEWVDANTVEEYPTYRPGDTVPYRIVVENTGQGAVTNLEITDDLFPEGSFTVEELAPGGEEAHEFEIVLEEGGPDTVVNTACATADTPEDSEVPPTINCDPAGIEIEGDPTHTKEITSATPIGEGQWEIVYELEVSNTSTASASYSLEDELHFTDQVSIVSAELTSAPDGVTPADPAWDGQGNTTVATAVPLLGTDDEGYAPHTYVLTVVADVPLQFEPVAGGPAATECAEDETDTAFNNTSQLTTPDGETEVDQACAAPPEIDVDKSVASGPTPNGDGTWTVTYDLVATNTGGVAGEYDISDQMTASGDLEVVSGSVTGAPEGVTPSADWTGLGDAGAEENVIATGVELAAGGTHTYQVEVVIGLAEGAEGAPVVTECSEVPSEGGGLSNTAEIEHNDLTADDAACVDVGIVIVDKSVSAGPTPNGDGTWTVVYDIVATHAGGAEADYDVTDRLHFGEGIEIVDHELRSLDGVEVNGDWTGLGEEDGSPENLVAADVSLAQGGSHTYQVEVVVQMDEATIDPSVLECPPPGSGDAGGLANSTTLTSNGIVGQDEVCPTITVIELDKQLVEGSPVENGDGTWTIEYDVSAANIGQETGDYELSDRLMYGEGLEVESASILTAPDGVEPNEDWTGQGEEGAQENVIVSGQPLEVDETHTFRVQIVASMDRDIVTPGDLECPEPGETGGFANSAALTHNGEDQDAEVCVPPPLIDVVKSLSGAVVPVDGEPGVYDATYEITVTNSGAGDGVYDLDDQLAPGEGVNVIGIESVASDVEEAVEFNDDFNGVDDLRIVTDQPINGAEEAPVVHTYTVVVRYSADLTGIETPAESVCTTAGGEPEPGTLGNTATVDWNGLQDVADECLIPGRPTLDKSIVSAAPIGDGQWEVVYDLTVANTGEEATTYDLDDEFLFAPQISAETVSVTGPEGITLNDAFDGSDDQRIATGIEIIGLDDEGYAPHVYTVTVTANVPLQFEEADLAQDGTGSPVCTLPAGGNFIEQGLNNAATLTDENGGTVVDTDCAAVPSIHITKAMDGDPVHSADGLWTISYTIGVANESTAGGDYTLTDQLRYGLGIDVVSAEVVAPDGITPAATWTGLGEEEEAQENVLAADIALGGGDVHTYEVVVQAQVDTDAADQTTTTCPEPGSGDRGGFTNVAGVEHNDLTADAAACAVPQWPGEVPPDLPSTGAQPNPAVLGAGLLLLLTGAVLVQVRRRAVTR
ncbi:DUF11 domain-containing protein [Ruania suaedae]|uniref:DUF11 domain-containing protein n=1 Tax=Ruania suaedae TaxID=2897774 RepID=UPI001E415B52|nr:DUF11 domain-containing protein [Ruania suaedae]UFU03759.1 DUF11 domain-containing protein [Ruania suaedae]